jgi:hypothetical protein
MERNTLKVCGLCSFGYGSGNAFESYWGGAWMEFWPAQQVLLNSYRYAEVAPQVGPPSLSLRRF